MDPPLPQPQTPPRPKNYRRNCGRRTPIPSSNSDSTHQAAPAAEIEKQPHQPSNTDNANNKVVVADKQARESYFQIQALQMQMDFEPIVLSSSASSDSGEEAHDQLPIGNNGANGFQNESSSSNSRPPIAIGTVGNALKPAAKFVEASANEKIQEINNTIMQILSETETTKTPIQQASSSSATKRKAANNSSASSRAKLPKNAAKLAELDALLKSSSSAAVININQQQSNDRSSSSASSILCMDLEDSLERQYAQSSAEMRKLLGTSHSHASVQSLMKSAAQVNAGANQQQIISPPPNDPSSTAMLRNNSQMNASNPINTSQRNVVPPNPLMSSSGAQNIRFPSIPFARINPSQYLQNMDITGSSITEILTAADKNATNPTAGHRQRRASGPAVAHMQPQETVEVGPDKSKRQVKTPENPTGLPNSKSAHPEMSPLSLLRKMARNPTSEPDEMHSASVASSQQPAIHPYQATKNKQNVVAGFLIQRQPSLNDFTLDTPAGRDFYSFETTTMANSTMPSIPGSSHQMAAQQQAMMVRPDFLQPHPIILQQQMEQQQIMQQFQLQQAHAANQMMDASNFANALLRHVDDHLKQVHNLYQQQFAEMERSMNKKLDDLQKLVLQRVSQKMTEQEESLRTTINDVRREMTRRLLPIELQMQPQHQPIQHAPVPTTHMGGNVAIGAAVTSNNNNGHHSAAPAPNPQPPVQHIVYNGPPNNFHNGNLNANMVRAVAQNLEPAPAGMPNNAIGGDNGGEDVQFLDHIDGHKRVPPLRKEGELKREPEEFVLEENGETRKQTAAGNVGAEGERRDQQQQNPAQAAPAQQQEAPRRLPKQEPVVAMEVERELPAKVAVAAAKAIMNLDHAHQPLRRAASRQNNTNAVQNRHDAVQQTQSILPRTLRPRRPSGSAGNNAATPSTHAMYLRARKTPDYTFPSTSGSSTPSTSSSSSASGSQQRRH